MRICNGQFRSPVPFLLLYASLNCYAVVPLPVGEWVPHCKLMEIQKHRGISEAGLLPATPPCPTKAQSLISRCK